MASGEIEVKKNETMMEEWDKLQQAIGERAYDLFRLGGGSALMDWLAAERELITKPAIELREKDGQFELLAGMPGLEPKDLDVQITSTDVVIKAKPAHEHAAEGGTVHMCEFGHGQIFRSVHFPQPIDPDSARAEIKNGMLRLKATVAAASTKKLHVRAA